MNHPKTKLPSRQPSPTNPSSTQTNRPPEGGPACGSSFPGSGLSSDSLPCLYSNISPEEAVTTSDNLNKLTPYHKRAAFTLGDNVKRFVGQQGLEKCGFMTLTFPDNVKDHKEASKRFDSVNKNYLNRFYGEWIWARERQKRGAWHYHLVINCKDDIRTGFDYQEFDAWITDREAGKRRRLRTGNKLLRSLWEMNNRWFPVYGFGRVELLPIRSTADAVAFYVGKYISKQVGQRSEEDKGVRLFSHSNGFVASSPKFSWNTDGGKLWRQNLALFARLSCHCSTYDEFTQKAGPKWAHKYRQQILEYQDHMNTRYPNEAPF